MSFLLKYRSDKIILVWVSRLIMSVTVTVFFLQGGPTLKPNCLFHFMHYWSTIKSLVQWASLRKSSFVITLVLAFWLSNYINSLINSWCKPIINSSYYLLNCINISVGYGHFCRCPIPMRLLWIIPVLTIWLCVPCV